MWLRLHGIVDIFRSVWDWIPLVYTEPFQDWNGSVPHGITFIIGPIWYQIADPILTWFSSSCMNTRPICNSFVQVSIGGVVQNHRPPTSHRPQTTDHRPFSKIKTDHRPVKMQNIDHRPNQKFTTDHRPNGKPTTEHRPNKTPTTDQSPGNVEKTKYLLIFNCLGRFLRQFYIKYCRLQPWRYTMCIRLH